MTAVLESIRGQVATLDNADLLEIARVAEEMLEGDSILYDVPGEPPGPSMEEVRRRAREIEEGKIEGIPLEKMLADLREYNRR